VDGKHLKPQCDKVEALMRIPIPSSKKLLRSFLRMVSFYRMFIPNVGSLTDPMSDMLRKGVREPLTWNEEVSLKFE